MISLIGFLVDIISFLFAMLVLPACTLIHFLTYDEPNVEETKEENSKSTKINIMKGETP